MIMKGKVFSMDTSLHTERITLGTCYYPEHWSKDLWEDDLRRMLENGIETIRIAEFAWSKFEPYEGVFVYDFFDEYLDLAQRMGMKVIFCTPTATPPAWLTTKYPEVLNANIDGVLYRHGARRHYNYNSPVYRALTARIVEKMAAHYAGHPAIVGWQIDNEMNCEVAEFYSESDTLAFRVFLQKKYKSLDALNEAWGTVFWNQTYTAWEEVFVPRPVLSNGLNPHQMLDYYRFISESLCSYAKLQSDILRKYVKKGDFVTTNGIFANVDSHRMTQESLDFITFDSYPNFAYMLEPFDNNSEILMDRKWGQSLSEMRSISPNFGIMEQQSGANGWATRMAAPTPKPGQMTLWTMQSIAHGADFVSYFRWRTCTVGTEIYWHGILDYSNRDNRRIRELASVNERVKKLAGVAGSRYEAKVAVLKDYDNSWDAQVDEVHRGVDKVSQMGIYEAAQFTHTPFDYVYLRDGEASEELDKYEVIFWPHAVIVKEWQAELLQAYVEAGGTLVLGCRTGYKDETGRCVMAKLPGLLQEISGTDVVEYSLVSLADDTVFVSWGEDKMEAAFYNDVLESLGGASVLGSYLGNDYEGKAALIENRAGKGRVLYFGAAFSAETAKVFLRKLGVANPYGKWIDAPEDIEIAVRAKGDKKYLFVMNYKREPRAFSLMVPAKNLDTGVSESGEVVLPAYGTAVYELSFA